MTHSPDETAGQYRPQFHPVTQLKAHHKPLARELTLHATKMPGPPSDTAESVKLDGPGELDHHLPLSPLRIYLEARRSGEDFMAVGSYNTPLGSGSVVTTGLTGFFSCYTWFKPRCNYRSENVAKSPPAIP